MQLFHERWAARYNVISFGLLVSDGNAMQPIIKTQIDIGRKRTIVIDHTKIAFAKFKPMKVGCLLLWFAGMSPDDPPNYAILGKEAETAWAILNAAQASGDSELSPTLILLCDPS